MNWDTYFIRLAELIAQKSKDPSTKVGCVIVGPDNEIRTTGFNGFPRGVHESNYSKIDDTYIDPLHNDIVEITGINERWERPVKYEWIEHAERNALYNAARVGVRLDGCRAYLNWEPRPCIDCARGFIQCGIVEVIGPDTPFPSGGTRKDWKFDVSTIMMLEAGVDYREVEWEKPKKPCPVCGSGDWSCGH